MRRIAAAADAFVTDEVESRSLVVAAKRFDGVFASGQGTRPVHPLLVAYLPLVFSGQNNC